MRFLEELQYLEDETKLFIQKVRPRDGYKEAFGALCWCGPGLRSWIWCTFVAMEAIKSKRHKIRYFFSSLITGLLQFQDILSHPIQDGAFLLKRREFQT